MEKNKYQIFVVCVRDACNGDKKIIKKGVHARCDFTDDKEAMEKAGHIIQRDFKNLFDKVVCSVWQGNVRRVGILYFPEKIA